MPQPFTLTPEDYDLLVDWPKRLANEGPFYRRLFERQGVRRVLDAACGTGQHLALFSRWGLECTGSDADPAMIERARATAAAGCGTPAPGCAPSAPEGGGATGLRSGAAVAFFVARFAELPRHVPKPFDAVLCVGNPLSMVPEEELEASLAGLAAAVRPDGVLVVHVLNALQFAERRPVFLPLRVRRRDGRPVLFQKIYEPREEGLGVHFLMFEEMPDNSWRSAVDSNLIANRPPERLVSLVEAAGFDRLERFGDYAGAPLAATSTDLILVAHKR